jgi:hypothetical protein
MAETVLAGILVFTMGKCEIICTLLSAIIIGVILAPIAIVTKKLTPITALNAIEEPPK